MKKIVSYFLIMVLLFINTCSILAYDEYKIGDKVTYKGEEYFVVNDSDANTSYVTLVRKNLMTRDELTRYIEPISNTGAAVSYYLSYDDNCYYNSIYHSGNSEYSGCENDFDKSKLKLLLDNWSESISDGYDLVEVDGYKARLLTVDELVNNFGFVSDNNGTFYTGDSTNQEFIESANQYWTMSKGSEKYTI